MICNLRIYKELREQLLAEDSKIQAILDVSSAESRNPSVEEQWAIDAIIGAGVAGTDDHIVLTNTAPPVHSPVV